MTDKRIIFLGTPDIAATVLEGLIKAGFNIVGVITKEDKVRGRDNKVECSPVAYKAMEYHLPVHKPHRLNKDFQFIKDLQPDLLLTFAYGQLISDEVLGLGKYKPMNLHGSILPKYRGAAPMQYALRNGDKETGVSLMEMVHEMDAGDVYALKTFEISEEDNYSSLSEKIAQCAIDLATEALPKFFGNELVPVKQDPEKVSVCHMISKEDEHLSLDFTSDEFINAVRSLSYVPGGYLYWNDEIIKIYKARKANDIVDHEIGTVVLAKKKQILLQLKDGQVNILELQRPGKKKMSSADFNNGVRNFEGAVLK